MGVPDLWDDVSASVSTMNSHYLYSIWSPCGHFIATATDEAVEIRGGLALNLLFTLPTPKIETNFLDKLAYSPDGHCLAYCSCTVTIIWDTQTGGVVGGFYCEVTACGLQLVWSLDSGMIGIVSQVSSGAFTIHIYEVISGTMRSFEIVWSIDEGYLLAHDESFQFTTTTRDNMGLTIDVYEVGFTLTKVERYHVQFGPYLRPFYPVAEAFSPATYRICTLASNGQDGHQDELLVLDIRNSEVLLREPVVSRRITFSPDGNFLAAVTGDHLLIWRYTSGHYNWWRKLQQTSRFVKFSPTSSSILVYDDNLLHVLHLDYFPPTPTIASGATTHNESLDAYPSHGAYIATAHHKECTITITNLQSQNPSPSQFIDTGLEISKMILTGNVLLVKGSDTVVAWLLTEEGVVDGTLGQRRVDCSNRIWDVPSRTLNLPHYDLWFSFQDEFAGIEWAGDPIHVYHTKTGEILNLDGIHPGTWRCKDPDWDHYHYDSYKHCEPPECHWPVSKSTSKEGWVKDPEGKHRLWLHPRWKSELYEVEWLGQVTTLKFKSRWPSEFIVVKF